MSVEQFAATYSVKVSHQDGGNTYVPGKAGHIGHGICDGRLSVRVKSDSHKKCKHVRLLFRNAGMNVSQPNDSNEVFAIFDPADSNQARLALQMAHVKVRRNLAA